MEGEPKSRQGELLRGKYLLEHRLGVGGMGEVYRARNTAIDRLVAIKTLLPELSGNDQVVKRFLREAKAANVVRHKYVVEVLDVDQDEHGIPFMVQEFLEGEDMESLLRRHPNGLPLEQALDLLIPVSEAVGAAHGKSLVHRDIKPANIFLQSEDGQIVPKVLDFGISKMPTDGTDVRLTATNLIMGSPMYMSPEQIEMPKEVDQRADVWALGVLLYETLSGKPPFDAETASGLFVKICTKSPKPLREVAPGIPRTIEKVVERCLTRDRKDRYSDGLKLAAALIAARNDVDKRVALQTSIGKKSPKTKADQELSPNFELNYPDSLKPPHASNAESASPTPGPAAAAPHAVSAPQPKAATAPPPSVPRSVPTAPSTLELDYEVPAQSRPRNRVRGQPRPLPAAHSLDLGALTNLVFAALLVVGIHLLLRYQTPEALLSAFTLGAVEPKVTLGAVGLVFIVAFAVIGRVGYRLQSYGLMTMSVGFLILGACIFGLAGSSRVLTSPAFLVAPWAGALLSFGFAAFALLASKEELLTATKKRPLFGVLLLLMSIASVTVGYDLANRGLKRLGSTEDMVETRGV